MDITLREKIKVFLQTDLSETPVKPILNPFWGNLEKIGTKIWLDTGDIEDAEKNWDSRVTALTTNNSLINNEIQKGIYDNFIPNVLEMLKDLPEDEKIKEIAFILNARHGLRIVKKFGVKVSVELHTSIAHDYDLIIENGLRYHEICPKYFIIKVPYTPTGLLGARKLREMGVNVNFTLEFSARQNVLVALLVKPNYLNVFMGRIGSYMVENKLGDGKLIGEKTVLSTQRWINRINTGNSTPIQLIAASIRNEFQLANIAGVDIFTIPPKVAKAARLNSKLSFASKLSKNYPIHLNNNEDKEQIHIEKFWEVTRKELKLAKSLANDLPKSGEEIEIRAREMDCADMFPELSIKEKDQIIDDGKIPVHSRWSTAIQANRIGIDTLLNLAGLASFTTDQNLLDEHIRRIISDI